MAKKILVVLLVGVIVWAAYFSLYFRPKKAEIDDLTNKLQEVRNEMEKKRAIAADLPAFNRNLEILNAQLNQTYAQLPRTKGVPDLLEQFGRVAAESGIQVTKFVVAPETVKGFYAELPINLELTGGYHNIAIFFDKVGKLERIINISNVQFHNPHIDEGTMVVNGTCLATTFRFLESEAPR
jgi:type IV pilus assembly protein PilO